MELKKYKEPGTNTAYKQTATYRKSNVRWELDFLACRCVNEDAYNKIKAAMFLIRNLKSEDFAEDTNGNIIQDLVLTCRPEWKDQLC